jgi:glycosyltransferase involved in cell wall biosynthesis
MRILITMPVYEDWPSAMELCQNIDNIFREEKTFQVGILLVDDGSTATTCPSELPFHPVALESISLLSLRRNLGHQRAIAVALAHIHQNWKGDAVVVMDADGEDRPEDILLLLKAMENAPRPTAVFAERGKRLENVLFRSFYNVYRALHRVLTGRDIRFGNFSALPLAHLDTLVLFPEMWNHYAATFQKSRLPYLRVCCDRARRKSGKSHMNFVSLVVHGLSALFANQEVVGTRLLVLMLAATLSLSLGIGAVVGVRLLTHLAIPGWATSTMGLLLILVSQSLIAAFLMIFSIMTERNHLGFLPIRDYSHFIRQESTLFSR